MKHLSYSNICLVAVCILWSMATFSQDFSSFVSPPQSARPRVWWHWLDGNISQEGIRKDLLWMSRVDIGGFQAFDGGVNQPLLVEKKVVYMTPEWKDNFRLATHLADSLNMEMGIASSPGWSTTGGPWVSAEDGMKKLTWREMDVKGGRTIDTDLPLPYRTTGRYLNKPLPEKAVVLGLTFHATKAEAYEDIRILAYRLSDEEINFSKLTPDTIANNDGLVIDYHHPVTVRAITINDGSNYFANPAQKWLQCSTDGINYREICKLDACPVPFTTTSIPPTEARYFRIKTERPPIHC